MNKLILVFLTFTSIAHADFKAIECSNKNIYLGITGGMNFLHGATEGLGITGAISLGYKFENNFRTEIELALRDDRRGNSFAGRTYAFMGNILYDINFQTTWTPYIGVGSGYSYTKHQYMGFLNNRWHPIHYQKPKCAAFQGIVGLDRELIDALRLGLEYRCFFIKDDLRDHSIVVSVKQYF